ncbi:peptide chain release factor 2, partial [Candidatus Zixiibacteriota bacterium]
KNAQKVLKEISLHKSWTSGWETLRSRLEDIQVLQELAAEEDDPDTLREATAALVKLAEDIESFSLRTFLSGEDDGNDCLVTIHSGAGGTESCDWTEMLLRMYARWIERRGFTSETLDLQAGEEAGVKSVTLEVRGEYAYGYLRAEIGVHRLVRISPFDANKRRHTSFASVFVIPMVDDDIDIVIRDEDLRVDTYRASGAGGQHVNKTSSAVRITHSPSGIVVQCQSERSQHKNRDSAMKVLRARLYQLEKEKEAEKKKDLEKSKKKIEWGSQIRSYVFQPYQLVKDHRTNHETSNIQIVMDGDLDPFINAYLSSANNETLVEKTGAS